MSELTVQISLSAGDADYAHLTVPPLLAAHGAVAERLLVVDVCKPQRTAIVNPAERFPEPRFTERVRRVSALAQGLVNSGQADRVEYLTSDTPLHTELRRTWLRPWMRETHDYGGCALAAYLAAFELCRTRWLVHYDADMLLHMAAGFDWAAVAQAALANNPCLIAATPRPAPPYPGDEDAPTRTERLPYQRHPAGWQNGWFSTRCFLFDVPRLRETLPLLQGRLYWRTWMTRLLRRGYPPAPEIMLFRRLGAAGLSRLILSDVRAWLLHPAHKDAAFLAALPRLIAAVSAGRCPTEQLGLADLNLTAWEGVGA